jgi:cyanate permease
VAADLANSFTRGEALRTSTLYMVILSFGLGGVGIGAMLSVSIPFLTDAGLSRTTAALMMSTMSLPALISKLVCGWLMDSVRPKVLAAIGFVLSGIAILVILAGANASSLPLLIGGFLLIGLGFGGPLVVQLYFDRVGNYDGAFLTIALLWVLAAMLILMVRRPVKPGAPGPPASEPPENGGTSAREDGDGVDAGEPERATVAVRPRAPPRDYMAAR